MTLREMERLEREFQRGHMAGMLAGMRSAAELVRDVSVIACDKILEAVTGRTGPERVQSVADED